ncbi:proline racemase family protein [Luteolibacter ambystomatis]|uniref:Proline racemase family protein n=1 Tax=Luteolibacter ambystomatis TaxID=2824561 RepID=A0A975G7F8_9BACT|nr:proline racemase family protein [Luteolibacter ambystomatis]QUE49690.1 proline racemase family protein [Luteolibacter ambystomatis]
MKFVRVIDSHTGGEPTRTVIEDGPDLGTGPLADRVVRFSEDHDEFRRSVVLEPRGSDVLVGALLVEPHEPDCVAGVIFFNNVGYLGMCGHGTIGLVVTLAHLGKIGPGSHRIDTPVGVVTATLAEDGTVAITNVPSRRTIKDLAVDVPGIGEVRGDLAWSGNWFYLVTSLQEELSVSRAEELTALTWKIRVAANAQGHPEIDHIELFGPGQNGGHSRNFVLCPGKAYDRSPCGTGTSAKLACLAADGKLDEGDEWIQESVVGSSFTGSFQWLDQAAGEIIPTIRGTAFITVDARLCFDPADPFRAGIV